MKMDMHYYGTYWAARMAGFSHEEAEKIAWAAQSVDELNFAVADKHHLDEETDFLITTETTSENLDDQIWSVNFANAKDEYLQMLQGIWMPFHFLPGNFKGALKDEEIYDINDKVCRKLRDVHDFWLMCRTNSGTVYRMIEHTAKMYRKNKGQDVGLYAIGVAMHVLADTWSHQNFTGGPASKLNCVRYAHISEKDQKIYKAEGCEELEDEIEATAPIMLNGIAKTTDYHVAGLGHGPAGYKPDIAWLRYVYAPGWGNSPGRYFECIQKVDNRDRFKSALVQMIESMRYIREGDSRLNLTKDYDSLLTKKDDKNGNMASTIFVIEQQIFWVPKPDQSEEWKRFLEDSSRNSLGEPAKPKEFRFMCELSCEGDRIAEEYVKDRERVIDFMKAAKNYRDDIISYINATLRKYESVKEDLLDLSLINKKILDETMGNGEKKDSDNNYMSTEQKECLDNEKRLQQKNVLERISLKLIMSTC